MQVRQHLCTQVLERLNSLSPRIGRVSFDGTVTTATLGFDAVWERWLTGVHWPTATAPTRPPQAAVRCPHHHAVKEAGVTAVMEVRFPPQVPGNGVMPP